MAPFDSEFGSADWTAKPWSRLPKGGVAVRSDDPAAKDVILGVLRALASGAPPLGPRPMIYGSPAAGLAALDAQLSAERVAPVALKAAA